MRELIAQLTPIPNGLVRAENNSARSAGKGRPRHLSLVR
jgi:hypothetical protein